MKKGYLFLSLLGLATLANAQQLQSPVKTIDIDRPTTVKSKVTVAPSPKKVLNVNNKTNSPIISALYDYRQALIDFDQQSTQNPTVSRAVMLLPDTTFTLISKDFAGTSDTAWTFDDYALAASNNAMYYSFNVGFTFDARSTIWSMAPNSDYYQLMKFNKYFIDSIQFNYFYIRSTVDSVKDKVTLQYLNNSSFKIKSGFGSTGGPKPEYPEVAMPAYDHTTNLAPNASVEKTFDLTINDTASEGDHYLTLVVNKEINTNSGQISAVCASYQPGTTYPKTAPFDSLGASSFNGTPIANPHNEFYYLFSYDQTRYFEDNSSRTGNDKVYINGLFASSGIRYDLFPPSSSLHDVFFPGTLIYTRANGTERVPVFPNFKYYITSQNWGIADLETKGFKVGEAYPNPTSGDNIRVPFEMAKSANITINVYNNVGQLVKTAFNGNFGQGVNGVDISTNDLSNGVYYFTMSANGASSSQRFVVAK